MLIAEQVWELLLFHTPHKIDSVYLGDYGTITIKRHYFSINP